MTNQIEIKIECKGKAVGTLGWFNSMMQDAELVVKETKDGTPGMFLKAKNKGGEGWAYSFICKKFLNNTDTEGYNTTNDYIKYIYAEQDNQFIGAF